MTACPSCGRENPDDARFCNACGAELAAAAVREVRKIVTVLFADVVGSTALGERTDPEALRKQMRSYFDDLRAIVERHGGTVEKFVGDAVMAVFGIPIAHEDDALRAVRAAQEMRGAITEHGLEARIGVNSGEVVTGSPGETLVTGDAVNVAARLEQAATPGEALIGATTFHLVRDAVRAEPVPPLALKGKSEPVEAHRLVEVLEGAAPLTRHLDSPLVGRERERQRLRRDFEDVVAEQTCRLFTLLGPAGIGKSRLVADFLESAAGDADVLRGRCLHYGEGITYWPLVEILIALRIDPESVIGSSPEETRLAFRRLLEARAAARPQVVVLDDLQWAEPVFLDLVEHVADFSRDAPIFVLCIARTELLDLRPGWGGGKVNATSLLLEPLDEVERETLIDNLLAGGELEPSMRERIAEASQGNPLFVEEMLAMVRERGLRVEVDVPPTIQALLQARLDALDGDERVVIERGAVEGEVFHRGAVAVLAPDPVRLELGSHLETLVRKELIRSVAPTFEDDEGFRFRHLLIRDAAYESLPKATRAELHVRFADWLADHDLVELDEILGYHLEQAHRYRAELDPDDAVLADLASRASERLTAAGNGAMDRGDWAAARSLFRRARSLLPPGDVRRALLAPQLSVALQESGDIEEAIALAREAREAEDPIARARGLIIEFDVGWLGGDEARARRDSAREVLERAADDLGLAHYWRAVGFDQWAQCRATEAKDAWERGISHAVEARASWLESDLQHAVLTAVVLGPTPVAEGIERAQRVLDSVRGSVLREASAIRALGALRAMQGAVDEGREMVARARATRRDAGLVSSAAGMAMTHAALERRAGNRDAQERLLRDALEELEEIGDRYFLPTVALYLAAVLAEVSGAEAEIESLCAQARDTTLAEDLVNFVYLDGIEGLLSARRGQYEEAACLSRRCLEVAEGTDHFDVVAFARLAAAETLALCGEHAEAAALAAGAVAVHEAKGDVTGAARARSRVREIGLEVV